MPNLRLTAYIVCLLIAMVNPVFAEDGQVRAVTQDIESATDATTVQETQETAVSVSAEKERPLEKEDKGVQTSITTIIETSISQQQVEASPLVDKDQAASQAELAENDEQPEVSLLEVMDALAQFGDHKKLADYIDQYYQQNPDIAQNKYPNLAYDAAITGMKNLLNYLIKHNPEKMMQAYEEGPTVLGYIAGDNQVEMANLLLKNQLDPNDPGNTDQEYPLYLAINSGNLQMITLLMDYGAKVHIGDRFHSPLGLILDNNDLQILNVIHAYDFRLESVNAELVRLLIDYLNSELVEEEVLSILLNHGFDPHQKNAEGKDFFAIADERVKTKDVLAMLKDLSSSSLQTEAQEEVTSVVSEAVSPEQKAIHAKPSEADDITSVKEAPEKMETSSSDEDAQEKNIQKEDVTQ
jgi:ankyrin repeat protein